MEQKLDQIKPPMHNAAIVNPLHLTSVQNEKGDKGDEDVQNVEALAEKSVSPRNGLIVADRNGLCLKGSSCCTTEDRDISNEQPTTNDNDNVDDQICAALATELFNCACTIVDSNTKAAIQSNFNSSIVISLQDASCDDNTVIRVCRCPKSHATVMTYLIKH
ncbi:hypothetical protein GJ496_010199 [Pomphorhynchus laevis]|nr:hypothetical protein GJ496_010199 [Pomphorhynchus laevis]